MILDGMEARPGLAGPWPHSREGPLSADLLVTKVLHVLNGGQTDRGKSSWTRQVLTWLAPRYPPEHVRLALIDLKAGSS
jgi:DNA segregation ATPase FtsK/SpoIIIE-like protein